MPVTAVIRRHIRVEMRPEGDKTARGAGLPDGEGADVGGSVITTELITTVCQPPPQPGRQSTVATEADTRATIFPKEAERLSIPIRGLCARKSRKSEEVKGNAPKTVRSGWGTIPLKPTPRVGEERVRRPQAQMREIPPSSTGVRLLDTLRSCFVAGSDERDRKATFPLALPFRSSNV